MDEDGHLNMAKLAAMAGHEGRREAHDKEGPHRGVSMRLGNTVLVNAVIGNAVLANDGAKADAHSLFYQLMHRPPRAMVSV